MPALLEQSDALMALKIDMKIKSVYSFGKGFGIHI